MVVPACSVAANVVDVNGSPPGGGVSHTIWLCTPMNTSSVEWNPLETNPQAPGYGHGRISPQHTVAGTNSTPAMPLDAAFLGPMAVWPKTVSGTFLIGAFDAIDVDSTAEFPASGQLAIGKGLALGISIFDYTSKTATRFQGVSGGGAAFSGSFTPSTTEHGYGIGLPGTYMAQQLNMELHHHPRSGMPPNAIYMFALVVTGVTPVTRVAGTITITESGAAIPFEVRLNTPPGSNVSWATVFVYRQTNGTIVASGTPTAKTAAAFHRDRTLPVALAAAGTTPPQPQHFKLIDQANIGDHDLENVEAIAEVLRTVGRNTVVLPDQAGNPFRFYTPPVRAALQAGGIPLVGRNVFLIPGDSWQWEQSYPGDSTEVPTDAGIDAWGQRMYESVTAGGWSGSELGVFICSDERAWYGPDILHGWTLPGRAPSDTTGVNESATGLAYFRAYLQTVRHNGAFVDATFFGASSPTAWSELAAVGKSKQGGTLAERRLYYWSMRFFAEHSNNTYAKCAAALRAPARFGPAANVGANLNNFQNRSVTPGIPSGNASADPNLNNHVDASFHSTDWIDLGEGGQSPHFEDFGGDFYGFQAPMNASIARAGANRADWHAGSYCGPAYSGHSVGVHEKRIMGAVGEGVKSGYFYAFGPPWATNGDGWAEDAMKRTDVFAGGSESARKIAGLEDLLWPGRNRKAQVAFLFPRVSEPWEPPAMHGLIADGANSNSFSISADYGLEMRNLWVMFMRHQIPVDWITEDQLTTDGLADYKMLVLSSPNVPEEGQTAVATWAAQASHVVWTCAGAGKFDRYNNAHATISGLGGVNEAAYTRRFIQDPHTSAFVTTVGPVGATRFDTYDTLSGGAGSLRSSSSGGTTMATFNDDGSAAIVRAAVGSGWHWHTNTPLGHNYMRPSPPFGNDLPANFQEPIWSWVTQMLTDAGVVRPVETGVVAVQANVLESSVGWGIVLVNWSPSATGAITLRIRPPFAPVGNVLHSHDGSTIPLTVTGDGYTASIPSFTTTRVLGAYETSGSGPVVVSGSQVSEMDTTNSGSIRSWVQGAQATALASATAGALRITRTGSVPIEADSASGGSSRLVVVGSRAVEGDSAAAGASGGSISVAGAKATEASVAGVGAAVRVAIVAGSRATQVALGRAGASRIAVGGGQGDEVDSGSPGGTAAWLVGTKVTEVVVARPSGGAVLWAGSLAGEASMGASGVFGIVVAGVGSRAVGVSSGGPGAAAVIVDGVRAVVAVTAVTGLARSALPGSWAITTDVPMPGGKSVVRTVAGRKAVEADFARSRLDLLPRGWFVRVGDNG